MVSIPFDYIKVIDHNCCFVAECTRRNSIMNHLGRNLIFCSILLSLGSVATVVQAAPNVAGASAAGLRGAASTFTTKAQAINNPIAKTQGMAAAGATDAEPVATQEAANPNPCQVPTLKDGSYIGVQWGYGTYRIRNDVTFPFTLNPVNANTNWSYGANIGYGKMLSSMFYLGGELFAVANTMDEPFAADDRSGFTYENTIIYKASQPPTSPYTHSD
jgi:hypothetical protein